MGAIALAIVAVVLLAHVHDTLGGAWLLDPSYGSEADDAEAVIRTSVLVVLAALLAPHALTGYAAIGILRGLDTVGTMRRYALVTCWSSIACALVAAWLGTHAELAFDAGLARLILGFCAVSFVAHACFVYLVARSGIVLR